MSKPGEVYWAAVETIWDKISIYDGPEGFLAQLGKTDRWRGLLYCAHWCRSEVWNGGLHQFFSNPTGLLAPEAVQGLVEMGLLDLAEVVREAVAFFGPSFPRDQDRRVEVLDAYGGAHPDAPDPFTHLDAKFYAMTAEDRFDLEADQYTKKNA